MSQVPQVEIVVPVRNEERDLAPSIRRLAAYLREGFPFTAQVTIADNGSTDDTWKVAQQLTRELGEEGAGGPAGGPGGVPPVDICAVHLDLPGRGRALNGPSGARMSGLGWATETGVLVVWRQRHLATAR